jgi:uncharacterized membrane protein YgaE (UPF0421/DUF939 family)
MHKIFGMLYGFNKFLAYFSRLYLYCFVVLFICSILNIFILIMEDAFDQTRRNVLINSQMAEKTENADDDKDEESEEKEKAKSSTSSPTKERKKTLFSPKPSIESVKDMGLFSDEIDDDLDELSRNLKTFELDESKLQVLLNNQCERRKESQKNLNYVLTGETPKENLKRMIRTIEDLYDEVKMSEKEQELFDKIMKTCNSLENTL